MVSCASSMPSFFVKTKLYLHTTTSSIRRRMISLVGTRSLSKKRSTERDSFDPKDIGLDSYLVVDPEATHGSTKNLRHNAAEIV